MRHFEDKSYDGGYEESTTTHIYVSQVIDYYNHLPKD
jgi:hypothetical protein